MKVYLAGPDVFRPAVHHWAESARTLCRRFGFEALLPIDHAETSPERIFHANLILIREAEMVVANLNSFRGAEPDSGTAFELGFAHALGKPTYGYLSDYATVAERVTAVQGVSLKRGTTTGCLNDMNGYAVENFELPLNLMLSISSIVVEGDLECCLRAIRSQLPGAV